MSHKTIDDRVFSGVMSKYLRKKGGGDSGIVHLCWQSAIRVGEGRWGGGREGGRLWEFTCQPSVYAKREGRMCGAISDYFCINSPADLFSLKFSKTLLLLIMWTPIFMEFRIQHKILRLFYDWYFFKYIKIYLTKLRSKF